MTRGQHVKTRGENLEERTASRRRLPRYAKRIVLIVVGLLIFVYAGAGWYVSGQIIEEMGVSGSDVVYDTDVLALGDGEIVLGVSDERDVLFDQDAVMGLRWEGGYGQLGPVISGTDGSQTRPFTLLEGASPQVGLDVADFDSYAFTGDPSNLGVVFETVSYRGPLGDLEAWHVPGDASTWIIAVHGRRADRTEFLRMIDSLRDLGYPILAIRYRNDPKSPVTDDSLLLFGQEEWEDVAAAADFAVSRGATGVVVHGVSMGGAIAISYAMEVPPGLVRGLVVEAAPADFRELIRLRSGEALPVGGALGDSILAVARLFVTLRTGLDFDRVDYTDRADELDSPVLWLHGSEDTGVLPVIGEDFAAARPDLVELHLVPDAVHVRAWNEDPDEYRSVLTDFLQRVDPDR